MSSKSFLTRHLESVHLLFRHAVSDTRILSARIMETFDVARLVFMKKSPKDKTQFRSVIIIFASQKNIHMLSGEEYWIEGHQTMIVPLIMQEAEDLIDQKRTKLYVGNIPYPVDNQILWNYFAQFGKLDYTYILKKPVQRGPKGFGFVIFQGRDSVDRALSTRNSLFGVKLNCKLFNNKVKKTQSTNSQESNSNVVHDEDDHCKNCCDECSEDEAIEETEHNEKCMPTEGSPIHKSAYKTITISISRTESQNQQQHSSSGNYCEERTTDSLQNQSRENPRFMKPSSQNSPSKQLFSTQDPTNQIKSRLRTNQKFTMPDDQTKQEEHPCGCETKACEDCWCDMIDSSYFCPPCCLCDYRQGPMKCHELLSVAKKNFNELHLHCLDHKDTETLCEQDVMEDTCTENCSQPCNSKSKYLFHKKRLFGSKACSFNLFG